ncbi:MAG: TlyA family RNA methyltransferase [Blastocatellia bacterium]|nr:TlyA family RNA methyltransferase [Blastocatellia bacterium]MCS7156291.1 TlyA family RNA methyltransferase [Blastocatellia bacterium]MCX7751359.1 TlyA family RNA methyltransferase [Blastocatellia bacterium]MDW8169071.1 TlyA family RNA methyltransferase [Acidobacteriota bacterium]MDW8255776.1 TlyA family RNA methyltransferase [Acidobacteriota bacterium]
MGRERIDRLLVRRGLAETRERAQALILAGQVFVDGRCVDKPGKCVPEESRIEVHGPPLRYVSRGGLKLEAALHAFGVDVSGLLCLDIGASTGGFTDCLLQHGARCVYAVDVGRGQLDWKLRQDPRVVVREGVNARYLKPEDFPVRFDLITIDVSFISLTKVLPAMVPLLKSSGAILALIKPQFEVGRREVGRGGIVRDPAKHQRVIEAIRRFAEQELALRCLGVIESPLLGSEGNKEFFIYLRRVTED